MVVAFQEVFPTDDKDLAVEGQELDLTPIVDPTPTVDLIPTVDPMSNSRSTSNSRSNSNSRSRRPGTIIVPVTIPGNTCPAGQIGHILIQVASATKYLPKHCATN